MTPPIGSSDGKAGRVMMSAYALCPTDMPHPKRMQWMADYFLANFCAWRGSSDGEREAFEEPLRKLLDYCDDSDGSLYGTLSTSLVRELVLAALSSDREMAPEAKAKDSVNQTGALRQEPEAAVGDSLIAKQARRIDALETELAMFREARDDIRMWIVGCGGPLNDNLHGYTSKQLLIFSRIMDLLAVDADAAALASSAHIAQRSE